MQYKCHHAIHKCKRCYIYVQTNEGAFTNHLQFLNIPACIYAFFLMRLDSQMHLFSSCDIIHPYIISLTISDKRKFEGMIECDDTALHLCSVQLCELVHRNTHLHTTIYTKRGKKRYFNGVWYLYTTFTLIGKSRPALASWHPIMPWHHGRPALASWHPALASWHAIMPWHHGTQSGVVGPKAPGGNLWLLDPTCVRGETCGCWTPICIAFGFTPPNKENLSYKRTCFVVGCCLV